MVSARTRHARELFAGLPATYDRVGALLSFGQDPRWRRHLVSHLPVGDGRVLDVAAGTGAVAIELIRTGRAGSVVALDQSAPMVREGIHRAARSTGPGRVAFVLAQAERTPFVPSSFDALTLTYLLRYVDDPAAILAHLAGLVRPGGVVASLEFGVPPRPWRTCWRLYTRRVMPAIGWAISPAWHHVGRFLGPSIEGYWERYPLEEQLRMWHDAGVDRVRLRRMSLGGAVLMWGVKTA